MVEQQKNLKRNFKELNEILKENPNYKSEDQVSPVKNMKKSLQCMGKRY